MIGEAADRMDAWLVAEGIETDEELRELIKYSVPLGQGYFLGRPAAEMKPLTDEAAASIRMQEHVATVDGLHRLMVPWMWALLRLLRFRGASHADDNDHRLRYR